MKKVLITGAKGQLGIDIINDMSNDYEVIGVGKKEIDISSLDQVIEVIKEIKPDTVINCAAYTNVDGAESNKDTAYKVNGLGCRNLAVGCLETKTKLVHISTDFVFDGQRSEPYIEFDKPNPLNIYGKSKLAGERFIKEIYPTHFILRTSWLYGIHGKNFVKTMLKLSKERDTLSIVNDQIGTPTFTKDLVQVIKFIMKTDAYGTYHVSNQGECSWLDFAKKIFEVTELQTSVVPITTEELNRPAKRPRYSVLKNYMLDLNFNYKLRQWDIALKDFLMS